MASTKIYIGTSLATICTTLVWSWIVSKRSKSQLPLPPSPKSDPFIGHLRALMNASDITKEYQKWSKELNSDIISLELPGQTIIVLNSVDAAEDLLSKRSSIYSDRPLASNMATNERLVGWANNTGLLPYGERWRAQRRISHEFLHKRASEDLWPSIVRRSRLALQQMMENPTGFEGHIRRMAGSSIIKSVYGYESLATDDALFETIGAAADGLAQALVPSNFYVNFFPWMQYIPSWFPGAQWKRKALIWRFQKEQMLNVPYNWTRDKMSSGTAPPSMLRRLLERCSKETSNEEIDTIRWATGTLFGAGTDTTVATSLILIAALAMHPEVQAKAQDEVDKVLHGSRFPEMDDRHSMPYLQAIVKEVFRWRSVTPMGVPHACIEEDIYKGYRIPKGATMAMSNDERIYPNPERFDPSRFLDTSAPEAPAFGFGCRSCPGIHFAQAALFMVASGLVSFFDIRPKYDSEGREIPLTAEMKHNVLISQPAPYEVNIKPRSEKHAKLLREWVYV